jgi:hypothetical protein
MGTHRTVKMDISEDIDPQNGDTDPLVVFSKNKW